MFSDCRLYKTYLSYTHLFLYIIFPTFFKQKCGGFRFPFFCEYFLAVTADAQCTFFSFKIGKIPYMLTYNVWHIVKNTTTLGKIFALIFFLISRFIFVRRRFVSDADYYNARMIFISFP